jgi:arylsulfatase
LLPTFAAAAGNADIVEQCMKTCVLGGKSFHVHLDGYNLMPFFEGEANESPRKEFLYWSDDGDLFAIRVLDWKINFIEQYHTGLAIWDYDYTKLRAPNIYNLRSDPFERGSYSSWYPDWKAHRAFLLVPAQAIVAKWLDTFKEYPIRQRPASFNLDDVMRKLTPGS